MPLGGVIDTDQDTRITAEENPDEDYLRFFTAGVERLFIDNSGGSTFLGTLTTGSINISQGSSLYYSTVNMTPNLSDIIAEKSFYWTSGTAATMTDVVITGFQFANNSVRGFNSLISVDAENGENNSYANYEIKGIQKGESGDWTINSSFIGDKTGIVFNITDSGQLRFSSDNEYTSVKLKFKAQTISIIVNGGGDGGGDDGDGGDTINISSTNLGNTITQLMSSIQFLNFGSFVEGIWQRDFMLSEENYLYIKYTGETLENVNVSIIFETSGTNDIYTLRNYTLNQDIASSTGSNNNNIKSITVNNTTLITNNTFGIRSSSTLVANITNFTLTVTSSS